MELNNFFEILQHADEIRMHHCQAQELCLFNDGKCDPCKRMDAKIIQMKEIHTSSTFNMRI